MRTHKGFSIGAVFVGASLAVVGCGDSTTMSSVSDGGDHDDGGNHHDGGDHRDAAANDAGRAFCQSSTTLDLAVCDPKTATFSLTIDNPFYPLVVGQTSVFEGEEDGEKVHLEIEVLDETKAIAGVETRIIEEREKHDGEIAEVSRNFFAQSDDGTVCYFGEEVDIYESGEIVSHDGAWKAGGKNRAGIVMPGSPRIDDFFAQEDAPDVAEDRAEIVAKNEKLSLPAGDFTDTLHTDECSPLEPGVTEAKFYARGVGLIVDGPLELISY